MNPAMRAEFAQALHRQCGALLKQVAAGERRLQTLAEQSDPELEERAQVEHASRVLDRLDERSLAEIAQIRAALQRIVDRTYGTCLDCGGTIPVARLRAVPTAALCVDCARHVRPEPAAPSASADAAHPGTLPADLSLLMDREIEAALCELLREDGRLDDEELRLVCRHGIVQLDGCVPSEAERHIVLRLLTDVAGCRDVVDRLRISELSWERTERGRRSPREHVRPARLEPLGTEDVVESMEDGLAYLAPDRPPADEER